MFVIPSLIHPLNLQQIMANHYYFEFIISELNVWDTCRIPVVLSHYLKVCSSAKFSLKTLTLSSPSSFSFSYVLDKKNSLVSEKMEKKIFLRILMILDSVWWIIYSDVIEMTVYFIFDQSFIIAKSNLMMLGKNWMVFSFVWMSCMWVVLFISLMRFCVLFIIYTHFPHLLFYNLSTL